MISNKHKKKIIAKIGSLFCAQRALSHLSFAKRLGFYYLHFMDEDNEA